MPKLRVLSDLDRTLFDTGRFFDEIWDFAASRYGLDAVRERGRAPDFHDLHGDFYDYRFFAHLSDAVGPSFEKVGFMHAAQAELTGRYLYPDVTTDVIERIDAIVTFGNPEYQSFKLLLCPQLKAIERHIILESKGEYIARTFSSPSLLIDDKRLGDEIRLPARFVRIDREKSGQEHEDGVIRSFSDLLSLLSRLEDD